MVDVLLAQDYLGYKASMVIQMKSPQIQTRKVQICPCFYVALASKTIDEECPLALTRHIPVNDS